MGRVKLADVARAAQVHPGTASRALNPDTRNQVNRETVERVIRAADKLGYIPNAQARALRTARSMLVGIVVPDITNPLFPPLVRGAEHVLTDAGYTVLLTDTANDVTRERRQIESLLARGVDGFILATALLEDDILNDLAAAKVHAVLTNRSTADGRWPYVGADEQAGISAAVEHLVDLGHRRIAMLAGPQTVSTGRDRAKAFRDATRQLGLSTDQIKLRHCKAYSSDQGFEAMNRLLESEGTRYTAVMCGNDLIALGVLDAIRAAGLSCPADISVVGFNDLPFLDRIEPGITTVRVPLERMGQLAADLLVSELDTEHGRDVRSRALLSVDLVVRGSTGPVRKGRPRRVATQP